MVIELRMPQLGESVTEGTLLRWFKKVGEPVHKYEPVAEVMTDKVTAELPADCDGILMQVLVQEGATVPVGTPIARIEELHLAPGEYTSEPDAGGELRPGGPGERQEISRRTRYSPAVRKLAREYGLRLDEIPGTGAGGRVTRKDVLSWLSRKAAATPGAGEAIPADSARGVDPAGGGGERGDVEILEASPIRRTIARHMLESVHTAPHAWTMIEVDVTGLVQLRQRLKEEFRRREGIELTYLPFFIKAVAETLREYPILNSTWADDRIIIKKRIHISVAVATDDALWVPVIRDADRLSVTGLAHAVHDLATRARQGRLRLEDVQGGTFTVNNTGSFGSILSKPILNGGQAAILSVEAIVKRPVVMPGDMIAIRSMVNLCLSLDHRVLDGWICGKFLQSLKRRLEAYREDSRI